MRNLKILMTTLTYSFVGRKKLNYLIARVIKGDRGNRMEQIK